MLKRKDKRISLTSDLIEGMKLIKFLDLEKIFRNKIKSIQ